MSPGLHKVVAPDVVPIGGPQPNAGTIVEPQPSPPWLFLRHFQSFPTPQSFDPFMVHEPPLLLKHNRNPPIPIPTVLRCQLGHLPYQPGLVVRDLCLATLRAARLTQHPTRTTLRNRFVTQGIANVFHCRPAFGRA